MATYRIPGFCMIALCFAAAGGCAPTQLGANYGAAYYTMMEGQMLNPAAEQNRDTVTGLDGRAAAIAVEQYRKSFETSEGGLSRSLISSGVQTK